LEPPLLVSKRGEVEVGSSRGCFRRREREPYCLLGGFLSALNKAYY
jgi:hypothetical protein